MVFTALVSALGIAMATANDPVAALKQIDAYREAQYSRAAKADIVPDYDGIDAMAKSMAIRAVSGINPASVDPKQAYAWMQLFSLATRHEDIQALYDKFTTTHPSATDLFGAEMLCLYAFSAMGKTAELITVMSGLKPTTLYEVSQVVSASCNVFVKPLVKSNGLANGLGLLSTVADLIPAAGATEVEKNQIASLLGKVTLTKAELLTSHGLSEHALNVLTLSEGDPRMTTAGARVVKAAKIRLQLIGLPAPEVKSERGYGPFPGLAGLSGKVVLLDFFAHWCVPCQEAFPGLRKFYKEFRGQGLEVVGVTRYYGSYGKERDLDKDTEFGKMAGFIKEFNMTWPVIYDASDAFTSYGVASIPSVAVIDRKGVCRMLHVGYSAETFAKFRKEVIEILNEK